MAQGYHDFTAGEVLTAANLEDYCERQAVMRFVDTTARDAALTGGIVTEGMVTYLTGSDLFTVYNGSAWVDFGRLSSSTTWTPTVAQGASSNISKTVNLANYIRIGNMVFFWVDLSLTAAGTAASAVTITLPVTAVGLGASNQFGSAMYFDVSQVSTARRSHGAWEFTSTTVVSLSVGDPSNSGVWGSDNGLAAASGDIIRGSGCYTVA